jgi:hypothetical protein
MLLSTVATNPGPPKLTTAPPACVLKKFTTAPLAKFVTITVNGTGFADGAAVNFFVHTTGAGMSNFGPSLAVAVVSTVELQFTLPAGTAPGAAYVQVINPPFHSLHVHRQ